MKKITLALCVVFVIVATGCNSGSSEKTTTTPATEAEQTTPASDIPVESSGSETANPPHGEPGHVHTEGGDQGVSMTLPPGGSGTGNVKLNPPHGEPGHRCDIAVGAPLPL